MSIAKLIAAKLDINGLGVTYHVRKDDCDLIRQLLINDGVIDWADSVDNAEMSMHISEFVHEAVDSAMSRLRGELYN